MGAPRIGRDAVYPIPENQPEGCTDLPAAIGPVGSDLLVCDSLGASDDLREPPSLDRCGNDVQGSLQGGHELYEDFTKLVGEGSCNEQDLDFIDAPYGIRTRVTPQCGVQRRPDKSQGLIFTRGLVCAYNIRYNLHPVSPHLEEVPWLRPSRFAR